MTRSGMGRAAGRHRRLARCAVLASLLFSTSALAQVPGEEIARRAFEEGVGLEKKSDFAGALAKFRESSSIKATLGNRFHTAYCLEMTGKLAAAFIEYEIVDKTAREQNKAEVVEATRVRLEPLRIKVPQLSLRSPQPLPKEAEVSLDGATVSPALLDGQAFRVDPGEHTVRAHAAEHDSFTKQLTAQEGAILTVDIVLHKSAPTAGGKKERDVTPPPVAPPPVATRGRSTTLPILTTAGAAALIFGGVVAFGVAGSEQSDAKAQCPTKPSCEDEKSTVRTLDAVALSAFIGGAGLAALSVVLWTSTGRSQAASRGRGGEDRRGSAEPPLGLPTLRARAAGSWIALEGRF